ncbi:MAG: hypothetical protein LBC20_06170 [Planctomycetaceae bacterium]|jgi:hypothetical protein|nr:hypothetical protein [Planctomycetaceae bacterium]
MKLFRIFNIVCVILVILLGRTFVSADIPPLKGEPNRTKQNQDRPNKQPPESEPQQPPDYQPIPTSKKRFGCSLFGTVDVPKYLFITDTDSATTNSNSPQLWADISPQQKNSETFVNTIIIAGTTTFMVVIFSGICLGYIVQRLKKKQESPSTPLESEIDTNTTIDVTEKPK